MKLEAEIDEFSIGELRGFKIIDRESSEIEDVVDLNKLIKNELQNENELQSENELKITESKINENKTELFNEENKNQSKKNLKMVFHRGDNYFDEKQEEKFYEIRKKAGILKLKLEKSNEMVESSKRIVDKEIDKLKIEWPALFGAESTKIYVHVDLDSFYASVETLMHPEYKDIPLGVGNNLMLSACNYKAREYGVRSGMPGYQAKDICPMLVITKLNFHKYNKYSEMIMEILSSYDPDIEIYGIDEACMIFDQEKLKKAFNYYNTNKTNGRSYINLNNKDEEDLNQELEFNEFSFKSVNLLISKIRQVIFRNTKLTASAGMSVCRGLAKFSSKVHKPNGQYVLDKNFTEEIDHLEIDEINGIGACTKELLHKALNIVTISDLKEKIHLCNLILKDKSFKNILRLSFGLSFFDSCGNKPGKNYINRTIGMEMSIAPTQSYSDILFYLWNISGLLEKRLKGESKVCNTITIKIRYINFDTLSRGNKHLKYVDQQTEIFNGALELINSSLIKIVKYDRYEIPNLINQIGIRLSGFVNLEKLNRIENYSNEKFIFNERVCLFCKSKFYNESQKFFEWHVNKCLDEDIKKKRKDKNKLINFFQRI